MRCAFFSLFAVLVASVAPAMAQTFTPAPNAVYLLDQDTQDGHFSIWSVKDLTGVNALRATVTVARLGIDKKWAPNFNIRLRNDTSRATLHISGVKGMMILYAESFVGDERVQQDMFLLPPEVGEKFGLEIDWKPDGSAVILVRSKAAAKAANGYERHEVKLSGPATSLEVATSTGELTLDPLQLGSTSP